jgi:CRP-like cAMP-binding protein
VAAAAPETSAFSTAKFQAKVADSTEFACAVSDDVSRRLKQSLTHLTVMGQLSATECMAHFILAMEELQRVSDDDTGIVKLRQARQEIADYLRLTTETVSRTITTLKDTGLLALIGKDAVSVSNRRDCSR